MGFAVAPPGEAGKGPSIELMRAGLSRAKKLGDQPFGIKDLSSEYPSSDPGTDLANLAELQDTLQNPLKKIFGNVSTDEESSQFLDKSLRNLPRSLQETLIELGASPDKLPTPLPSIELMSAGLKHAQELGDKPSGLKDLTNQYPGRGDLDNLALIVQNGVPADSDSKQFLTTNLRDLPRSLQITLGEMGKPPEAAPVASAPASTAGVVNTKGSVESALARDKNFQTASLRMDVPVKTVAVTEGSSHSETETAPHHASPGKLHHSGPHMPTGADDLNAYEAKLIVEQSGGHASAALKAMANDRLEKMDAVSPDAAPGTKPEAGQNWGRDAAARLRNRGSVASLKVEMSKADIPPAKDDAKGPALAQGERVVNKNADYKITAKPLAGPGMHA